MSAINRLSGRHFVYLVGLSILLVLFSHSTRAQIAAEDRQALIDLYQATGGDDWLNNDGWLGEPGSECEWHGVYCLENLANESRYLLVLSTNNLIGELPDSLSQAQAMQMLLAENNQISGTWRLSAGDLPGIIMIQLSDNQLTGFDLDPDAAPQLFELRLSGNQIEGNLPPGLQGRPMLETIDLSHNQLSGDLPNWLGDLNLEELNLADNQFTGEIGPALDAMKDELEPGNPNATNRGVLLDLRANQFSGEITAEALAYEQGIEGWLNLCWNNVQVSDPTVISWLQQEHFNGEFEHCLGKTVEMPPLTASGSWYNPSRNGEGLSMMQLDDGQTLIHWFTYAPDDSPPRRQSWLVGNRTINHPGFDSMLLTGPFGGSFGLGLPDPSSYFNDVFGNLVLTWTNEQKFESWQSLVSAETQNPVDQNIGLVQLTQLAGTSCDNQSRYQQYSGAWYNPERDGEGFVVEVLPDDRVVVYWFTYTPDDSGLHAWMIGDGTFDSAGPILIDPPPPYAERIRLTLVQTDGGVFGPDFDPEMIDFFEWGDLAIRFDDDDNGHVNWDGPADYGTGDYPIQRLARPLLAECE